MVKLATVQAVNEVVVPEQRLQEDGGSADETLEAQEARLVAAYEAALRAAAQGSHTHAINLLQDLLQDPAFTAEMQGAPGSQDDLPFNPASAVASALSLVNTNTRQTSLMQLYTLALRNLAGLLPQGSEATSTQLYCAALLQSTGQVDAMVWQKLGRTAAKVGLLGLARYALERGISASGRHTPLYEQAMELSWKAGDPSGAADMARRLLWLDNYHPDARAVQSATASAAALTQPLLSPPAVPSVPPLGGISLPGCEYPGQHKLLPADTALQAPALPEAPPPAHVLLLPVHTGDGIADLLKLLVQIYSGSFMGISSACVINQGLGGTWQAPAVMDDAAVGPGDASTARDHGSAARSPVLRQVLQAMTAGQGGELAQAGQHVTGFEADGLVNGIEQLLGQKVLIVMKRPQGGHQAVGKLPGQPGRAGKGGGGTSGGVGLGSGLMLLEDAVQVTAADQHMADATAVVDGAGQAAQQDTAGAEAKGAKPAGSCQLFTTGTEMVMVDKVPGLGASAGSIEATARGSSGADRVHAVGEEQAPAETAATATAAASSPGTALPLRSPSARQSGKRKLALTDGAPRFDLSQAGGRAEGRSVRSRAVGPAAAAVHDAAAVLASDELVTRSAAQPKVVGLSAVLHDMRDLLLPVPAPPDVFSTGAAAAAVGVKTAVQQSGAGDAAVLVTGQVQPQENMSQLQSHHKVVAAADLVLGSVQGLVWVPEVPSVPLFVPVDVQQSDSTAATGSSQQAGDGVQPVLLGQLCHAVMHRLLSDPGLLTPQIIPSLLKLHILLASRHDAAAWQQYDVREVLLLAELHAAHAHSVAQRARSKELTRVAGERSSKAAPGEGRQGPGRSRRQGSAAPSDPGEGGKDAGTGGEQAGSGKAGAVHAELPKSFMVHVQSAEQLGARVQAALVETGAWREAFQSLLLCQLGEGGEQQAGSSTGLQQEHQEHAPQVLLTAQELPSSMDVDGPAGSGAAVSVQGLGSSSTSDLSEEQRLRLATIARLYWVWGHVAELQHQVLSAVQLYTTCASLVNALPSSSQLNQAVTRLGACTSSALIAKLDTLRVYALLDTVEVRVAELPALAAPDTSAVACITTEHVSELVLLAFQAGKQEEAAAGTAGVRSARAAGELRSRALHVLHVFSGKQAGDPGMQMLHAATRLATATQLLSSAVGHSNSAAADSSTAQLPDLLKLMPTVESIKAQLSSQDFKSLYLRTIQPPADDVPADSNQAGDQPPNQLPSQPINFHNVLKQQLSHVKSVFISFCLRLISLSPISPADAPVPLKLSALSAAVRAGGADPQPGPAADGGRGGKASLAARSHAALLDCTHLLMLLGRQYCDVTTPATVSVQPRDACDGAAVSAQLMAVDEEGSGAVQQLPKDLQQASSMLGLWSRVLELLGSRLSLTQAAPWLLKCYDELLGYKQQVAQLVGGREAAAALLFGPDPDAADDPDGDGDGEEEEEEEGEAGDGQEQAGLQADVQVEASAGPRADAELAVKPAGRARKARRRGSPTDSPSDLHTKTPTQRSQDRSARRASVQGARPALHQAANAAPAAPSPAVVVLLKSLYGALGQLLCVLLGVKMDWRDASFGNTHDSSRLGPAPLPDIASVQEVCDLWRLLEPLTEVLVHGKQPTRLKPLLERMCRHTPAIPAVIFKSCSAVGYLDDVTLCDRDLALGHVAPPVLTPPQAAAHGYAARVASARDSTDAAAAAVVVGPGQMDVDGDEMRNQGTSLVSAAGQQPQEEGAQELQPQLVDLHQGLHYLVIAALDPEASVTTYPTEEAGHKMVEQAADQLLSDLVFNPCRLSTWDRVLQLYAMACRWLLDSAASEMSPADWRKDSSTHLQHRLSYYQQRAVRATVMCLTLGADEAASKRALWQESLGRLYFNAVQGCTPVYDSLAPSSKPDRTGSWQADVAAAYILFERAFQNLNEEWTFCLHMAKLIHKLKDQWPLAVDGLRQRSKQAGRGGPEGGRDPAAGGSQVQAVVLGGTPGIVAMSGAGEEQLSQQGVAQGTAGGRAAWWVRDMLRMYGSACRLAQSSLGGGVIDAVYHLHAARVKVLLEAHTRLQATTQPQGAADAQTARDAQQVQVVRQMLQEVSCYCFLSNTLDEIRSNGCLNDLNTPGFDGSSAGQQVVAELSAATQQLLNDCCEAMRWCYTSLKAIGAHTAPYHRAHYQLAKVQWHLRQPGAALDELKPVVGPGTAGGRTQKAMVINVALIAAHIVKAGVKRGRRRGRHLREGTLEPDSAGLKPSSVVGVGEEEEERDAVAAARRTVKLYLQAAAELQDLERLDQVAAFLATDRHWSAPMSDLATVARGLHTAVLWSKVPAVHAALGSDPNAASCQEHSGVFTSALSVFLEHVVDRLPGPHTLDTLQEGVAASRQLHTPPSAEPASPIVLADLLAAHVQKLKQGQALDQIKALVVRMRKRIKSVSKLPASSHHMHKVLNTCIEALVSLTATAFTSSLQQLAAAHQQATCPEPARAASQQLGDAEPGSTASPAQVEKSLDQAAGSSKSPRRSEEQQAEAGEQERQDTPKKQGADLMDVDGQDAPSPARDGRSAALASRDATGPAAGAQAGGAGAGAQAGGAGAGGVATRHSTRSQAAHQNPASNPVAGLPAGQPPAPPNPSQQQQVPKRVDLQSVVRSVLQVLSGALSLQPLNLCSGEVQVKVEAQLLAAWSEFRSAVSSRQPGASTEWAALIRTVRLSPVSKASELSKACDMVLPRMQIELANPTPEESIAAAEQARLPKALALAAPPPPQPAPAALPRSQDTAPARVQGTSQPMRGAAGDALGQGAGSMPREVIAALAAKLAAKQISPADVAALLQAHSAAAARQQAAAPQAALKPASQPGLTAAKPATHSPVSAAATSKGRAAVASQAPGGVQVAAAGSGSGSTSNTKTTTALPAANPAPLPSAAAPAGASTAAPVTTRPAAVTPPSSPHPKTGQGVQAAARQVRAANEAGPASASNSPAQPAARISTPEPFAMQWMSQLFLNGEEGMRLFLQNASCLALLIKALPGMATMQPAQQQHTATMLLKHHPETFFKTVGWPVEWLHWWHTTHSKHNTTSAAPAARAATNPTPAAAHVQPGAAHQKHVQLVPGAVWQPGSLRPGVGPPPPQATTSAAAAPAAALPAPALAAQHQQTADALAASQGHVLDHVSRDALLQLLLQQRQHTAVTSQPHIAGGDEPGMHNTSRNSSNSTSPHALPIPVLVRRPPQSTAAPAPARRTGGRRAASSAASQQPSDLLVHHLPVAVPQSQAGMPAGMLSILPVITQTDNWLGGAAAGGAPRESHHQ